ncbi:MAG: DUF4783 domain-containing protein [Crocinitomicaceae bacterium]
MSYFYLLLASLVLSFSGADIPHNELEKAFNANDAKAIVELSKEKVLLNVLGNEGAYSQSQANIVLKDFFSKQPNGKFSFIFKGKEADSGTFSIGNYVSKGTTFRVTFHFKKIGSVFRIETLTIES